MQVNNFTKMSIVLRGEYASEFPKEYNLLYSTADTYMQVIIIIIV